MVANGDGGSLKSTVSGTVTDSDGNAIGSATVKTGTGVSTTTASDGTYSLELDDGSHDITASKTGYLSETQTVSVSGSDVSGVDFSLAYENTISGTVTDQSGSTVENATVRVTTVDTSTLAAPDPQTEAFDRLDNASTVRPDFWDPSLQPRTRFDTFNGKYPVLFKADVSGGLFSVDSGDLSDPIITVDSGETFKATAYDASQTGGLAGFADYARQQPGGTTDGTLVFEQVASTNETTNEIRVPLSQTNSDGAFDTSELSYAEVSLPDGYYRVYHEDNPSAWMPLKVGNPVQNAIQDNLETIRGAQTEQAQWVQDQIANGPLGTQTVVTNESGYYSASVGPSVTVVGAQAYKASSIQTPPKDLSVNEIRGNTSDLNGSVYLPSRLRKYEAPTGDADIKMYEVSYPPYGNLTDYQDRVQRLRNQLQNGSFDEMPPAFTQAIENITTDELEETNDRLERLTEENEQLRERYETIADERNITVDVDSDQASRAELAERTAALKQAIEEINDPVTVEPVAPPSTGDGTISRTWAVAGDVTKSGTVVRLDYSNGTTQYLNATDSEYVSVDNRVGRTDQVTLADYPLTDTDPATVSVTPIIATDQGVGRQTDTVRNPTFDGTVPSLRSVDVSSLRPETGESVSLTMRPDPDSGYANVSDATVYAPDGSTVTNTVTTDGVTFTPQQTGIHKVRITMQSTDGAQFTETVTLRAVETGQARPPSVRTVSGPTGTYAMAGAGLSGADINVRDGGSSVDVTAIAAGNRDEAPSELHVYTAGLSTAPDASYNVGVVEGDAEKALTQNVRVTLHGPPLEEDDYVYRETGDESEPLPRGESPNGIVRSGATNSSIQTFTSDEGAVGIRINSDPSTLEQINWFISTRSADISVPSVGFIAPLGVRV